MKQCVICNEEILEDREKWVILVDIDYGEKVGETYYHLQCWKERFQITNSERKKRMYKQMGETINKIKNNFGKGGMMIPQ